MADFIITSIRQWNAPIAFDGRNLALELAKQNRVLFVNPPADIASRIRSLWKKGQPAQSAEKRPSVINPIQENLWTLDCPFTLFSVGQLPRPLFDLFNRLNGRRYGKYIRRQAAALGFKDYINLIDEDLFRSLYLKEYLKPALSIYYRCDYLIGFRYWRKNGPHCEEALARKADIVLGNSAYFTAQLSLFNPNSFTMHTGVNLDLFDASRHWEKPTDMQAIPSPVIGYLGALVESRLDSNLIYNLARRLPSHSFVLVGPEDEHFRSHPLHGLSNVFFLGRKEVEEVPQYIRYFDVCINPQTLNEITEGNYPLKINEYLVMGKPVVATTTQAMRDAFAGYTHLAGNEIEWLLCLQKALAEKDDPALREKRIAFANTHTWAHSVETMNNAIKAVTNPD